MRIVLVVHGFPPHERTGVETHVAALAWKLAQRGLEVEVFAPRRDARTSELAQRREARDGYHVTWITVNRTPRSAEEHFDRPEITAGFAEFLDRRRPALVHFHHFHKLGIGVLEETARRAIPSLYTAHDYAAICHRTVLARPDLARCSTLADAKACARCDEAVSFLDGTQRWSDYQAGVLADSLSGVERAELARFFAADQDPSATVLETRARLDRRRRAAFDALDVVLAPTDFLRAQLIAGGLDPAHVEKDEYGIETRALAALPPPLIGPARPLTFGYVGGASKHKGLHVLLEAFAGLKSAAQLVIHADSTDREHVRALRERARALGAEWRGAFSAAELPRVLAGLDVLVVPSIWWENAPFVIREAFAAHRPVIASDTPALRESVRDGVDGILVAANDTFALRAALEALIQKPERLSALSAGIRAPRELEAQCDALVARYSELASREKQLARARKLVPAQVPPSARPFAERVALLELSSVSELAEQASVGIAALARQLGVAARHAHAVDSRELALEHLRDARRENAWRAASLEHEQAARESIAAELERALDDGAQARSAFSKARSELAAQASQLAQSAEAREAARAALAGEQAAHARARAALESARAALDESAEDRARLAAGLSALDAERDALKGELAHSHERATELERAKAELTASFAALLQHAQWLERESAALARRVGHSAPSLSNATDFSAAQAEFDLFERELDWRRREMQAARESGGKLLRAIVERSGLGRRMRRWKDGA